MQPTLIVSTGLNGRSAAESVFIRPVNSVTFNSNYFLPGVAGRRPRVQVRRLLARFEHDVDQPHRRLRDGALPDRRSATTARSPATGCQVDLTRDGFSVYDLMNYSAYVQDTITHGRATLQLGLRYDYNKDTARRGEHRRQPARRSVAAGDQLPRRRSRAWRSTTSRRVSASPTT